jgi:hypothetical protein
MCNVCRGVKVSKDNRYCVLKECHGSHGCLWCFYKGKWNPRFTSVHTQDCVQCNSFSAAKMWQTKPFLHLLLVLHCVHFVSSVAYVWVTGAKTTGPIAKKFCSTFPNMSDRTTKMDYCHPTEKTHDGKNRPVFCHLEIVSGEQKIIIVLFSFKVIRFSRHGP